MDDTSIPELSPEERRKAKQRDYQRAYYARHREAIKRRANAHRATHLDEIRQKQQAWRDAHREQLRIHDRAYYQRTKTHYRQKQQAWVAANRERVRGQKATLRAEKREVYRAYARKWAAVYRLVHPEKYHAYRREWTAANRDKVSAKEVRRRARKYQVPRNDFTAAQWQALLELCRYRCVYCGKKMTRETMTRDHLTPYVEKGSNTLQNVLPACRTCNSRKGIRNVLKPVQPFLLVLLEEKAKKK